MGPCPQTTLECLCFTLLRMCFAHCAATPLIGSTIYIVATSTYTRPEPIMLKNLPIILSRVSQRILLLFFLLFLYPAYYSIIILFQYKYVASPLVLIQDTAISSFVQIIIAIYEAFHLTHHFSIHNT